MSLEVTGGNAKLKMRTGRKFLELKDKSNICDIWRIKHPKLKTFKHFVNTLKKIFFLF